MQWWHQSIAWARERIGSRAAAWWLFFFAAIESIFFPVPVDVLFVSVLLAHKHPWVRVATLSLVGSIAGAIVGYIAAWHFADALVMPLVALYGAEGAFATVQELLHESVFFFTLIGAVTPIPFKIFVLAAGFVYAPIVPFIIASLIGRGVRFYLIAYLAHRFGDQGIALLRRYALPVSVISVVAVSVYILAYFLL